MRISMDTRDRAYDPDAWQYDVTIRLDGVEVKNCVTADSDEGELMVMGTPIDGRDPITIHETPNEWTCYWYKGKVEIEENGTGRRL